ncbi:hypothetical protein TorRG33x02_285880 [Trema orientale]|uniref:Uncharacterized protein n=1 Tax=Trema orientale TaxID=63057 RepID=A0A2P5CGF7_TREOI|nr:hypothetical protein TorRG33x02_285880 [Trema orientale]
MQLLSQPQRNSPPPHLDILTESENTAPQKQIEASHDIALPSSSSNIVPEPRPVKKSYGNLPPSLKMLMKHGDEILGSQGIIVILLEHDIIGDAHDIYVLREDISQFCKMTQISATFIIVYIR